MGEARRKKLAGVPQPTEKTPRPKTPRGRRAFRQVKVTYAPKFGQPQLLGPNPREFLGARGRDRVRDPRPEAGQSYGPDPRRDRYPGGSQFPQTGEAMTGIFVAWSAHPNSPGWVEDGTGCHIWVGNRNNCGYGAVKDGGMMTTAHRARYKREIGPIPEGLVLHHTCDRGAEGCCNPHHCEPVTQRENLLRGDTIPSAHLAKTHCPKGHPLSGDNLMRAALAKGRRNCRLCDIASKREARRRKSSHERSSGNALETNQAN